MLNLRKAASSLLFLAAMLLTGCAAGRAKEGYNLSLSKLKSMLKDPESLKISGSYYTTYTDDDKNVDYLYRINYNAKNSYGAYTGYSDAYFEYDHGESSVYYWESGSAGANLYEMCKLNRGETKI